MIIKKDEDFPDDELFIFCLESVDDVEDENETEVFRSLRQLSKKGIPSIHTVCDTIEGFEDSLNNLLYDDHNFQNYEIIYLVLQGEENRIKINNYFYTLEEVAELFEGKMRGKIIHFANKKKLDLTIEESQYFLNVTGARAISGYGAKFDRIPSYVLDQAFFALCEAENDITRVVEELFQKHYNACKLLDFRLYY